jgi:hypothetical protein
MYRFLQDFSVHSLAHTSMNTPPLNIAKKETRKEVESKAAGTQGKLLLLFLFILPMNDWIRD